ncbi:uncharacterized protein Dwil_GK11687 [Drosophila willistoni]|uniref:Regucalcin n=1 Tax=Drosophila willistoni TaxID=7260 RepID=A0A0Q9X3C4_DROWI|nr:uncharacterized protein LOC6647219 [Drosophila willistoni]KRF99328.1 uncharacterized protein Dwil_GK11687 [Drosophila willistoni]
MKWVFLGLTLCGLVAISHAKNYQKNNACLVKNKYRHESTCRGPRRQFYAFHRIIMDCIRVTTKCPQFHKKNEYPSLARCQSDCAYHMKLGLPKTTVGSNTTTPSPDAGAGGGGEGNKEEKKEEEKKEEENKEASSRTMPVKFLQRTKRAVKNYRKNIDTSEEDEEDSSSQEHSRRRKARDETRRLERKKRNQVRRKSRKSFEDDEDDEDTFLPNKKSKKSIGSKRKTRKFSEEEEQHEKPPSKKSKKITRKIRKDSEEEDEDEDEKPSTKKPKKLKRKVRKDSEVNELEYEGPPPASKKSRKLKRKIRHDSDEEKQARIRRTQLLQAKTNPHMDEDDNETGAFALRTLLLKSSHKNMSYVVEALPDSYAFLGEGPHWDVARQSLYYVDLERAGIHRYDYKENKVYKAYIENETFATFIIPIEGNKKEFAVGCDRRVSIVNWDGVSPGARVVRTLFEVQSDLKDNRLNDAKVDPRGRWFGGTMCRTGNVFIQRKGELYMWQAGGEVNVIKSDVGISNGLAWDEKAKKFYYVDTNDYEVKAFDYNVETGGVCNSTVIYDFRGAKSEDNLQPDGMAIDTDGNIYVATFNGAAVYKVDPRNSELLLKIEIPTKQITSVAFGGPNLDILYVTTAAKHEQPVPAGTTFKVTGLNAKGLPGVNLKI